MENLVDRMWSELRRVIDCGKTANVMLRASTDEGSVSAWRFLAPRSSIAPATSSRPESGSPKRAFGWTMRNSLAAFAGRKRSCVLEAALPMRLPASRSSPMAMFGRSAKDALADEEDRQRCSTVRKSCLRIQEAISHGCNRRCQRQQRLTNGYSGTADATMSGVFSLRSANRSATARWQETVDKSRAGSAVLMPRQGQSQLLDAPSRRALPCPLRVPRRAG